MTECELRQQALKEQLDHAQEELKSAWAMVDTLRKQLYAKNAVLNETLVGASLAKDEMETLIGRLKDETEKSENESRGTTGTN